MNEETDKKESGKQVDNSKIKDILKKQDINFMPDKSQNGSDMTEQKHEEWTEVGKKVHVNMTNKQ